MKARSFLLTLTVVLLAMGFLGCSRQSKDTDGDTSPKETNQTESRLKQGTNGQTIVTLDVEAQKVMGLQVMDLPIRQLNPEVKGYGRVLDASPLAALVTAQSAAQAASDSSAAELKRMKTLAASDNASARALQTIEVDAARDRAQVESGGQQLLSGWGSAIANRTDLPTFVQSLVSLDSALVEIVVPAGESLESPPTGARLASLTSETKPVEAQFIAPAPMMDSQLQGEVFWFLVKTNSSRLVPGTAVTGWLSVPGESLKGVVVPEAAIVRYEEKAWAYVLMDGTNFMRKEVVLDRPFENGWFITDGVQPGDKVVITSVQTLLSEELKSQTPIGD